MVNHYAKELKYAQIVEHLFNDLTNIIAIHNILINDDPINNQWINNLNHLKVIKILDHHNNCFSSINHIICCVCNIEKPIVSK